jgi:hypothetical protein
MASSTSWGDFVAHGDGVDLGGLEGVAHGFLAVFAVEGAFADEFHADDALAGGGGYASEGGGSEAGFQEVAAGMLGNGVSCGQLPPNALIVAPLRTRYPEKGM